MVTAQNIIEQLSLIPLDGEGGYYRQTFKDPSLVLWTPEHKGTTSRPAVTTIYYLVTPDQFSALHKLPQTEIIHFYLGSPVEMVQISPDGELKKITLGQDIKSGHQLQVVINKNVWQGTRLVDGGNWALMGATVSPGFEFEDLEVAAQKSLISHYPQYKEEILRFTRG